jgi:multidrug efflux pump subunit AcrB
MDSYQPGKKEMQLKLKPTAQGLGLTLTNLAAQVRNAFYGAEALRLQRGEDEVKVMVRFPEAERGALADVENMRIRTPAGMEVPFSEVAEVNMERGYASLQRVQRQRVITVYGNVDETVTNSNELRSSLASQYLPQLKGKYPGLAYTMEGEAKEQAQAFGDVFKGFAVALFCIYALLAIPFGSFTQPFIVMAAIPFGIVGAIVGHIIMGYNISMFSLLGCVGLSGVVVNDSLVLVHATNRIRDRGHSAFEAIVQAGALRFRAIILTSLTTFAGLIPMLLERSMQARFMIPMAISLGFGVLFATGITLLLIPCLYMVRDDVIHLLARIRGKAASETAG